MNFGCVIPNRGNPLFTPEEMKTQVVKAEEMGFEHAWFSDHVILPNTVAPRYPYSATGVPRFTVEQPYSDPLTVMAFMAGATSRIKFGTGVLVIPYRPAVLAAKIISTIDYFSGGRVILGIGVGWMEEEFVALGLDTFRQRGKVTDEFIRVFRELWSNEDPEYDGDYVKFSDLKFYPKPAQKPGVPIWVGGNTPPAIRRAARLGDGWIPIGARPPDLFPPDELAKKIGELRDLTEKAGRPRDDVELAFSCEVDYERKGNGERWPLTGTPQEIADDLKRYHEIGVRHYRMGFPGDTLQAKLDNMERFANEVRPKLAA